MGHGRSSKSGTGRKWFGSVKRSVMDRYSATACLVQAPGPERERVDCGAQPQAQFAADVYAQKIKE